MSEWDVVSTAPKSEWDVVSTAPKVKPPAPKKEESVGLPPLFDEGLGYVPAPSEPNKMPYSEQMSNLGQVFGAGARGAVKGALGALGAIEEFASYTVPEYFGAKYKEKPTVFPTPEIVGQMVEEIGLGKTPEKYKKFETAGEVLGGFKGFGGPAKEAGEAAIDIASASRGPIRAAISPEASLAAKISEPTTTKSLGGDIYKKVIDRLKDLRTNRAEEAAAHFENFYRDARPVEGFIREGYINDLKDYLLKNQGKLSKDKEEVIRDAIKRVGKDAKIEALDEERRILAESIDPAATGADAIKNEAYKVAHDLLKKNITDRVKTASETYNRYAELSKEINQYGTTLGKKFTRKAGEYLPEISAVELENIPNSAFKNETTVAALKRLSGDPAFVEDAARKHISNELTGKLKPEQVRKYILDNEWLNEVPQVKQELQGLYNELSRGQKLRYGTYIGGAYLAGSDVLNKLGKFLSN